MAKNQVVDGLAIDNHRDNSICESCARNKGRRVPHPTRSSDKSQLPGVILHFDTVGPMADTSLGGSRYYLLCKDEASGYRHAAFVESKDQIKDEVKRLVFEIGAHTGNICVKVFTDNGTEFVNEQLEGFFKKMGITHGTSAPYTPQQNGYVERDMRTVTECARTILNGAKLPRKLCCLLYTSDAADE